MNTEPQAYLTDHDGDRLLKIAEVSSRVALGKTSIYGKVGAGTFPAPVVVGPGAVRWRKSEVDAWMASLPKASVATVGAG